MNYFKQDIMTNKISRTDILRKNRNKDGRPKLPTSQKKSYGITVKLATADYYLLKAKAREMGVTISELIRSTIKNCVVKQRLNAEHLRHILQLTGMANNVNQLAKKAHVYGYLMAEKENLMIVTQIENVIKLIENDD